MAPYLTGAEVNLREADRGSWKRCGMCVHFNPEGACELVIGPIEEADVCDQFFPNGLPWNVEDEYDGVIAAGIAVVALDSGRVLLQQRSNADLDDPARGRWEFPGGTLEEGERPIDAAAREWKEETGMLLPQDGYFFDAWKSDNGVYIGYIFVVPGERSLELNPNFEDRTVRDPDNLKGAACEVHAWFEIDGLEEMPQLREEVRDTPWAKLRAAVKPTPPHARQEMAVTDLLETADYNQLAASLATAGIDIDEWFAAGFDTEFAPVTVSRDRRKNYAKRGIALPDGSYPIPDVGFLKRAIQSYGRAPEGKRAAVRAHIIKRARALKRTDLIPDEWKKDMSMAAATPITLTLDIDAAVQSALAAALQPQTVLATTTLPDHVELTDEDFTWRAMMLVENAPTGDGRFIEQDGIVGHRDLPLSLMVMFSNPDGGGGHAGATIAGRIDGIEKIGNEWWGFGIYDRDSAAGREAARLNKLQMLRGISVDLDGPPTVIVDSMGRMSISNARIMGATQCPFAAFAEAHINLVKVEHDPTIVCPCKALKAEMNDLKQGEYLDGKGNVITGHMASTEVLPDGSGAIVDGHCGCGGDCCGDTAMALVASGAPPPDVIVWTPYGPGIPALLASGAPVAPPAAWFEMQQNPAIHPVRMTSEGQILGYAAVWGECHLGNLRDCTPVPQAGPQGYHRFHTGQVRTAEGTIVQTGTVFMGGDHPDKWLNQQQTMAAYAATSAGVGDIRVYEDSVGIYCCGAARPEITEAQVRTFNAVDGASPDWRPIGGQHELVAMLMVNMTAFHVPSLALVASGAPGYMVAEINPQTGEMSAIQGAPPIVVNDPIETRMALLETKIAFVDALRSSMEQQMCQQQVDAAFAGLPDPVAEANAAALAALDAIAVPETVEA